MLRCEHTRKDRDRGRNDAMVHFSGTSGDSDFDFMMIRVASSIKKVVKNTESISSPYESIQECASGEMLTITAVRIPDTTKEIFAC